MTDFDDIFDRHQKRVDEITNRFRDGVRKDIDEHFRKASRSFNLLLFWAITIALSVLFWVWVLS